MHFVRFTHCAGRVFNAPLAKALCLREILMFFSRNKNNQAAVDKASQEFSNKGAKYLLALPDYGSSSVELEGNEYSFAWWRWKQEDELVHFVFQIDQKIIASLYYKFLSGFKLTKHGEIQQLESVELV